MAHDLKFTDETTVVYNRHVADGLDGDIFGDKTNGSYR